MTDTALANLTDQELREHCVKAIWAAAVGESRGGDDPTYNRAMELMAESTRRHTAAGHHARCSASIYATAYEQATAENSYRTPQPPTCTCAALGETDQ